MKATSLISSQLFISLPACPHIPTPADVLASVLGKKGHSLAQVCPACGIRQDDPGGPSGAQRSPQNGMTTPIYGLW